MSHENVELKVSIRSIIGKVVNTLRLNDVSSSISQMADWAVEAELKIGSKNSYRRHECEINIKNHRACLPVGFVYLIALKHGNHILDYTNKSFHEFGKGIQKPTVDETKFISGNAVTTNPGQPNVHQIDFVPIFTAGDVITITINNDNCGDVTINTFQYVVQPGDTITDIINHFVNEINTITLPYTAIPGASFFQVQAINNLVNLQVTTYSDSVTGSISNQLIARRIRPTTAEESADENCIVNVKEGSENLANKSTALLNDGMNAEANNLNAFSNAYGDTFQSSKFAISNGYIHFNAIKEGKIGVAYMGIELDEEGWPLIARVHESAIVQYIMWMYKYADYVNGKISHHVYKEMETRWYTLCGQARGDDELPNEAELRYLNNMWMQSLPLPNKQNF